MNLYIILAVVAVAVIAIAAYVVREKKSGSAYVTPVKPVVPDLTRPPVAPPLEPAAGKPLTNAELNALDPRWDLTRPKN